ncbi:MAG: RimK family alpha-L-glutamate ligase [Candidatus Hodarchaeota archaeon]
MSKKVVFSARQSHEIIKAITDKLSNEKDIDLFIHDPTKDFFYLSNMPKSIKEADLIIVKVRNECSIDLLHFAKINNIATLHDVDTVLMCKSKIALDYALRKIFKANPNKLKNFSLPKSWTQNLKYNKNFESWAKAKLPIVIKSHYQHDKWNRFTFLVRQIDEIETFRKMYQNFLIYDVYIQKFIECDGIERKFYVIGEKVFGIQRENPIYIFMRENPNKIKVNKIERRELKVTEEIEKLSKILAEGLNLRIFGFDLVKAVNQDRYYLIDLNDFPGFRGISNVENILSDYLKQYILKS